MMPCTAVSVSERSRKVLVFFFEANLVGHAAQEKPQFVERRKGLGNVIVGAQFHGLNGGFHRAMSGHDRDLDAGKGFLDLFEKLQSGHAGHDHVGQDHVDGLLLVEHGQGRIAAFGLQTGKAQRLADGHAEAADGLFVVHDQQTNAEIFAHNTALPIVFSTTAMNC